MASLFLLNEAPKQGAPESGLFFIAIVNAAVQVPQEIWHQMFNQVQPVLAQISFVLNKNKTAYLTTHPHLAAKLPGTNANDKGLSVLGQKFKLEDNKDERITRQIGVA